MQHILIFFVLISFMYRQRDMKREETTVARLTNEMGTLKQDLIVQQRHIHTIRIALIGCTGVGKSSVGNTLLGKNQFEVHNSATYMTKECKVGEGKVGTRYIKVVDTPGIISSDGTNTMFILKRFLKDLAPGPHAIIIVIQPTRDSAVARRSLEDLRIFFDDDHFFDFTMLVMVRKTDIIGDYGACDNIQEFISQKSAENVKKLYMQCKERIVAIENKQSMDERTKEAEQVFEVIDKMDGYYAHQYFRIMTESKKKDEALKEQEKVIADLQKQVKQLELEESPKKWFYFF